MSAARRDNPDGNLDIEAEEISDFAIGEAVRLKNRIVRDKAHKMMGPRLLMSAGWPNLFYVERTGHTAEGESAVILSACCFNLHDGKGGYRCKGHLASCFEKTKPEITGEDRPSSRKREREPGDRTASVVTPLGEVASWTYEDDEDNPGLVINILGKKFQANGLWLKQVAQMAKERGIL